jgi:DNA topoisomerase IA
MSGRRQTATVNATARVIQNLAERNHVTYSVTDTDRLAHHITRLAGDVVELDPIEQLLIGLQRAGRIDRVLMVRLQARYLREAKP